MCRRDFRLRAHAGESARRTGCIRKTIAAKGTRRSHLSDFFSSFRGCGGKHTKVLDTQGVQNKTGGLEPLTRKSKVSATPSGYSIRRRENRGVADTFHSENLILLYSPRAKILSPLWYKSENNRGRLSAENVLRPSRLGECMELEEATEQTNALYDRGTEHAEKWFELTGSMIDHRRRFMTGVPIATPSPNGSVKEISEETERMASVRAVEGALALTHTSRPDNLPRWTLTADFYSDVWGCPKRTARHRIEAFAEWGEGNSGENWKVTGSTLARLKELPIIRKGTDGPPEWYKEENPNWRDTVPEHHLPRDDEVRVPRPEGLDGRTPCYGVKPEKRAWIVSLIARLAMSREKEEGKTRIMAKRRADFADTYGVDVVRAHERVLEWLKPAISDYDYRTYDFSLPDEVNVLPAPRRPYRANPIE